MVAPGEMIGWTTRREWHLHLSEWHFPDGRWERRIPVNPLSRTGKLAPYADTEPPVIHDIRFMTPSDPGWRVGNGRAIYRLGGSPLDPGALAGLVDVRAWIDDPQSFRGWIREVPELETAHHPSRIAVKVVRLDDGKVIVDRDVFVNDVTLGPEARALGPQHRLGGYQRNGAAGDRKAPCRHRADQSGQAVDGRESFLRGGGVRVGRVGEAQPLGPGEGGARVGEEALERDLARPLSEVRAVEAAGCTACEAQEQHRGEADHEAFPSDASGQHERSWPYLRLSA